MFSVVLGFILVLAFIFGPMAWSLIRGFHKEDYLRFTGPWVFVALLILAATGDYMEAREPRHHHVTLDTDNWDCAMTYIQEHHGKIYYETTECGMYKLRGIK